MNNDLISREALRKSLEELKKSPWCCEHRDTIDGIASRQAQKEAFQIFENLIDNAPTVEAEKAKESEIIKAYTKGFDTGVETVKDERLQGEWKVYARQGGIPISDYCTNCKYEMKWYRNKYNYCPNYGAKMKV